MLPLTHSLSDGVGCPVSKTALYPHIPTEELAHSVFLSLIVCVSDVSKTTLYSNIPTEELLHYIDADTLCEVREKKREETVSA